MGALGDELGVEVPDVITDKVGDAASGAVTNKLGGGKDKDDATASAAAAMPSDPTDGAKSGGMFGSALSKIGLNKTEEVKGMEVGLDAAAVADGARETMKLNYQQPGKKAATILSPHLETLSTGSIFIELENSQTSLPIGQPIKGKIKVNLTEAFEAKSITLGLCGYQRSHFQTANQGDQFGKSATSPGMTRLAKNVLDIKYIVANFDESEVQSGQSEYPFSLVLPDCVNESIMLQFENNNLSETYYLKAQMEPRNQTQYANLKDETSMLRTDYALYLYRPNVAEESKLGNPSGNIDPTLSKTLTMTIGGIVGLGSSEAKSVISLEKHRFAPGEKIKVMIDCDNTQCKKAVKSYKIKFQRKISCLSGKKGVGAALLSQEDYIVALKYDGCAEKVRD